MLMWFWSKISRMFLWMFLLIILRQKKNVYSILLYLTHYHNIDIITKPQILKFLNKIIASIIDNTILRIIITINITITIINTKSSNLLIL